MLLQRSIPSYNSRKSQQSIAKKLIRNIDKNLKNKLREESMVDGGMLAKLTDFNDKLKKKKRIH
jgi:hypothetical protein